MSPGNQQKPPPVDGSALPPGPRWPVLVQTAGLLRFRHRFHPYMRKRYGDIFTVRIAPGGRPLVFFTRPEHAKEIFAGDAEEFRSLDRMNRLTLEVILRVVFGVTDEARLAELRPRVNKTVNISPAILLCWGYPRLQKFGPWKRTVDNQHELDRLMYAEIRERRTAPDLADRTDVLSRLIVQGQEGDALDDTELRDQLVTLLLAG